MGNAADRRSAASRERRGGGSLLERIDRQGCQPSSRGRSARADFLADAFVPSDGPAQRARTIGTSRFGAITVAGEDFPYDVVIRLDGRIEKRRKKLSKAVHGTSHKVSADEVAHILGEGADRLIVGSGQYGALEITAPAADYLEGRGCAVEVLPTPRAVEVWNAAEGAVIGVFHVTC